MIRTQGNLKFEMKRFIFIYILHNILNFLFIILGKSVSEVANVKLCVVRENIINRGVFVLKIVTMGTVQKAKTVMVGIVIETNDSIDFKTISH